jgi:hypothetical protein
VLPRCQPGLASSKPVTETERYHRVNLENRQVTAGLLLLRCNVALDCGVGGGIQAAHDATDGGARRGDARELEVWPPDGLLLIALPAHSRATDPTRVHALSGIIVRHQVVPVGIKLGDRELEFIFRR